MADTLTPSIRVLEPDGTLRGEITWEAQRTISPDEAMRAVVDSAVARAEPNQGDALRRRLEEAPIPEQLSVFWDFIVDDEGFIWVRPFDLLRHALGLGAAAFSGYLRGGGGPGGEWLIFSPEGEELPSVLMPSELDPFQITTDAVVGIQRDSMGVESVHVYGLQRW